jgi:hypothetical protein
LAILTIAPALLVASSARAQSEPKENKDNKEKPAETPAERSAELTPPIALPTTQTRSPTPVNPWWVRPELRVTAGKDGAWSLVIYGFAELDMLLDSTRSFGDGLNANVIAYPTTQAYQQPRLQFSARDSRLGFKAQAPEIGGVTGDAVIEMDFFANGPTINAGGGAANQAAGSGYTTEGAFFSNPGIRIRHAYMELKSPVVNILAGQSWHVLGWQNYFFPGTPAWLGVPNEIFNRTPQLRFSHTFESDSVNFDIVAAAFRPVQRDSAIPDAEGGIRLAINHWKGITTPGSGGTGARAAAIGVSGLARWFRVDPYAPLPAPPIQLVGWAAAGHILLPIVPVKDSTDRGNALTITGEAVMGTGDADQYGMTAGATMPNVNQLSIASTNASLTSTPASAGNAPIVGTPYTPDVDPGLVAFDTSGVLHTINWKTFLVGLQYYLPPSGRVFITGNYSQGYSDNIASLYHPDSPRQPWVNAHNVFQKSWYTDANLWFDATPAARIVLSYQYVQQQLADATMVHNHRGEMAWFYFF